MPGDPRSCGSIACIINAEGRCWCGLQWNGQKMVKAPLEAVAERAAGQSTAATVQRRRKTPAKKPGARR